MEGYEKDEKTPIKFKAFPHIGMFQDSFLIMSDDENIDIRYLPHPNNIAFYNIDTDDMPLYAKNIGNSVIYLVLKRKNTQIKLNPGETKLVSELLAEKDVVPLPNGDLYPATMANSVASLKILAEIKE